MSEAAPGLTGPVTVIVRRRVKAGREADYERWLAALIREASALPGYLGTQVLKPPEAAPGARAQPSDYVSVFRFDSPDTLLAFEQSELRSRALQEVAPLVEADATWERLTGLELWFTAPPGTPIPQPSRLRMALLLSAVVYGLVVSIGALVAQVLSDAPSQLRLLTTIVIEVFLMTYLLMPWLTRSLAGLIYPAPKRAANGRRVR